MEEKIKELIEELKNKKYCNNEHFKENENEIKFHAHSQYYIQELGERNHYILGENSAINYVLDKLKLILESEE